MSICPCMILVAACEKIEDHICAEHSRRPLGDNYGITGTRAATLYLSDFPALPSGLCVLGADTNLVIMEGSSRGQQACKDAKQQPGLAGRVQLVECCFYVHRNLRAYWGREPRTATSTFTQLLSSVVTDAWTYMYRSMD